MNYFCIYFFRTRHYQLNYESNDIFIGSINIQSTFCYLHKLDRIFTSLRYLDMNIIGDRNTCTISVHVIFQEPWFICWQMDFIFDTEAFSLLHFGQLTDIFVHCREQWHLKLFQFDKYIVLSEELENNLAISVIKGSVQHFEL